MSTKPIKSTLCKGDSVQVVWSDGLILTGSYSGSDRGYILLTSDDGQRIVCGPSTTITKIDPPES